MQRPSPRVHLSGTSSPAPHHYNNISVLGSGRLVMHDTAQEEVIRSNPGATLDESGQSSTPGKPNSGGNMMQEELSMSLPTAGAFTTFGQMSHRKNQPSHHAERESSATHSGSSAHTGDGATVSPRAVDPMHEPSAVSLLKQASFSKGTLSKEHSFKKNSHGFGNVSVSSSSNNIAAMPPLEKQRSVKGDGSHGQGNNVDHVQNIHSPGMLRNATTLDLETSPDHEEDNTK